MLVPAHRETSSLGRKPACQPLAPKAIYGCWRSLPESDCYSLNLGRPPRDAKKCHATRVEEDPMATQDIQCLWRGGGVALIQTKQQFPQPKR